MRTARFHLLVTLPVITGIVATIITGFYIYAGGAWGSILPSMVGGCSTNTSHRVAEGEAALSLGQQDDAYRISKSIVEAAPNCIAANVLFAAASAQAMTRRSDKALKAARKEDCRTHISKAYDLGARGERVNGIAIACEVQFQAT